MIYSTGNRIVDAVGKIQFTGNIIPETWYQTIKYKNGKPNMNAIMILADIVYWYRPSERRNEADGSVQYKKRFADSFYLQRNYAQISQKFGLTNRQSREAVIFLEKETGVIKRHFKNVRTGYGQVLPNVMFIELLPDRLSQITFPEGMTSECHIPDTEVKDTPHYEAEHDTVNGETNTKNTTEIKNRDYDQSFFREKEDRADSQTAVFDAAQDILKKNIEYDILLHDHPDQMDLIDTMVETMAEIISSKRNIVLNGTRYEANFMQGIFMKLNMFDIQFVLTQFKKASEEKTIKNKMNYLIRMLMTAKAMAALATRADVNYNLSHGGMIADFAIHDKGTGNPHAHILLTVRGFDEQKHWEKKQKTVFANRRDEEGRAVYDPMLPSYDSKNKETTEQYRIPALGPDGKQKTRVRQGKGTEYLWEKISIPVNDWNDRSKAEIWRASWADMCNQYLTPDKQIDHRSFERQGIEREPTIHEGHVARGMEQDGKIADRCEINREIRNRNLLRDEITELAQQITDLITQKAREIYERIKELRRSFGVNPGDAEQAGTDKHIDELKEQAVRKEELNERIKRILGHRSPARRNGGPTGEVCQRTQEEIQSFIDHLNAKERTAEKDREARETERRRLSTERERRTEETSRNSRAESRNSRTESARDHRSL